MPEIEVQDSPVVPATLKNLAKVNAVSLTGGVGIQLHIFTLAPDKQGFKEVVVDFNSTEQHDGFWRESFVYAHPVLMAVLALLQSATGQKFTRIKISQPMEMYHRADFNIEWDEFQRQRRQEASANPA